MRILPWRLLPLAAVVVMLSARFSLGQINPFPATTQTTASKSPTTQPAADVQRWWNGLADADSKVRETSFAGLLGLSRDDLPTLRTIVSNTETAALQQAMALRDIVLHVYLSGETYSAYREHGFLGLMGPEEFYTGSVILKTPVDQPNEEARSRRQGVRVNNRVPGFVGYQSLRTGDILLSFRMPADPQGEEASRQDITAWAPFTMRIAEVPPGTLVTFEVLRQGKIIEVPIKLSARPTWASDDVDAILLERQSKFERYWQETFAPLVGETLL